MIIKYQFYEACPLVAITGTTGLVPYTLIKSLQPISNLGEGRFHLLVPYLRMSLNNFIFMIGYQDSSPDDGHQKTCCADSSVHLKLGIRQLGCGGYSTTNFFLFGIFLQF